MIYWLLEQFNAINVFWAPESYDTNVIIARDCQGTT